MKSELKLFPNELLIQICTKLDEKSIVKLGETSKTLNCLQKDVFANKKIYEQIQWNSLSLYQEHTQSDLLVGLLSRMQQTNSEQKLTEKQTKFYLKKLKKFLYEGNPLLIPRTLALILINLLAGEIEDMWINKLIIAMKLLHRSNPTLIILLMALIAKTKQQYDLQKEYLKKFDIRDFLWHLEKKFHKGPLELCLISAINPEILKSQLMDKNYFQANYLFLIYVLVACNIINLLDESQSVQLVTQILSLRDDQLNLCLINASIILNKIATKIKFCRIEEIITQVINSNKNQSLILLLLHNLDSKQRTEIFLLLFKYGISEITLSGKTKIKIIRILSALKEKGINLTTDENNFVFKEIFLLLKNKNRLIQLSPVEILSSICELLNEDQIKKIIDPLIKLLRDAYGNTHPSVAKSISLIWQKLSKKSIKKINKKINKKILEWIKSNVKDNYSFSAPQRETFELLWPLLDITTKSSIKKLFTLMSKRDVACEISYKRYLDEKTTPKSPNDLFIEYITLLQAHNSIAITYIAALKDKIDAKQIKMAIQNFYISAPLTLSSDEENILNSHVNLLHKLTMQDMLSLTKNLESLLHDNKFKICLLTDVIVTFPAILKENSMAKIFDGLCNLLDIEIRTTYSEPSPEAAYKKYVKSTTKEFIINKIVNAFVSVINRLDNDQVTRILNQLILIRENYQKLIQNKKEYSSVKNPNEIDNLECILDDIAHVLAKLLKKWEQGHKYFPLLISMLLDRNGEINNEVFETMVFLARKLEFNEAEIIVGPLMSDLKCVNDQTIELTFRTSVLKKITAAIAAIGDKIIKDYSLIEVICQHLKLYNSSEHIFLQAIATLSFSTCQTVGDKDILETLERYLPVTSLTEDIETLLTNQGMQDKSLNNFQLNR